MFAPLLLLVLPGTVVNAARGGVHASLRSTGRISEDPQPPAGLQPADIAALQPPAGLPPGFAPGPAPAIALPPNVVSDALGASVMAVAPVPAANQSGPQAAQPTIPPPTPPPVLPPAPPAVGPAECELLEEGLLVEPRAECRFIQSPAGWQGCTCTMTLPGNVNPMPDNAFNPFIVPIPPDPNMPTFPPMAGLPPPSNPMQPYVPMMMKPACPYSNLCGVGASFACVGHDSWGFNQAIIATYMPAAGYLNTISCNYVMQPGGKFKVPPKVASHWTWRVQKGEALGRYAGSVLINCPGDSNGTNATNITDSWGAFCNNMVKTENQSCSLPWKELWSGPCEGAAPPTGLTEDSSLGEICPFECVSGDSPASVVQQLEAEAKAATDSGAPAAEPATSFVQESMWY